MTATLDEMRAALTRRELLAAAIGTAGLAATSTALGQAELPASSRELWQWVRSQPVLETQIAYLDTASVGPTLRAAMAGEYRARELQSLDVADGVEVDRWTGESNRLATRFASYAGCDADEIFFTRGAGEALSTVVNGLDLVSGDEVITTNQEHPSALSPWLMLARRRGIVIKQVVLPTPMTGPEQALGLIAGAVTERTKVLCFSHVQYADGALLPVRELTAFARQRNLVSVVNGAQAWGMLEVNVRELGCDFYAAAFHKWLGGCQGTGLLYVRREMLDRVWPLAPRGIEASPPIAMPTSANGQSDVPAAMRKLGNAVPYLWPALRGSEAAVDFQTQVGRSRIEARVRELAIYLRLRLQQVTGIELLTPARPGLWAGILTFRVNGREASVLAPALTRSHRVYLRSVQWPEPGIGALRASLHIFNSHDDVERLIQGLQQALRS